MKECERRYFEAAIQFCELVKKNNNGVFPIDLMSLSDDVIFDVVFEAAKRRNNFDLMVLCYLKFSKFECFSTINGFVDKVFYSNNPRDNLFFLFCIMRHINSIFYAEREKIQTGGLCSLFGELELFNKFSCESKLGLYNIFRNDLNDKFKIVYDSSIAYIKSMEKSKKMEISEYFQYLILENGFDSVLFLGFLNATDYFLLNLEIIAICNNMEGTVILNALPYTVEDENSNGNTKRRKK